VCSRLRPSSTRSDASRPCLSTAVHRCITSCADSSGHERHGKSAPHSVSSKPWTLPDCRTRSCNWRPGCLSRPPKYRAAVTPDISIDTDVPSAASPAYWPLVISNIRRARGRCLQRRLELTVHVRRLSAGKLPARGRIHGRDPRSEAFTIGEVTLLLSDRGNRWRRQ
jgi:hypothetical protein